MKNHFESEYARLSAVPLRERLTDLYLIIILCGFPLFPGFSGYQNITFSKYLYWMSATGLWLGALLAVTLREQTLAERPSIPQIAALSFLGICLISWLLSPNRAASTIGAGRFDGLLTDLSYLFCFLGVSGFTRPKMLHAAAFAVGSGLCCGVAVVQLFGGNPLRLFPGELRFFDRGIRYSGAYLGTVGNTNILDALLCVALPLFFALYVGGESPLFLLPLLPGCFVEAFAGGSGAAVAFGVWALAVGPALLTYRFRLRRALRGGAVVLAAVGFASAYRPEYAEGVLTPRFALTTLPVGVFLAAGAALIGSILLPERFAPAEWTLRRGFLCLDAAAVLGALASLWFWPGQSGTLYEMSETLHGRAQDGFGSSRILIWRNCLALVKERPILGGGPGTLALRLDIPFSRYVPETGRTLTSRADNAHNIYLSRLLDCGGLGLAAYLGVLLAAGREAVRRRQSAMTVPLALSALCAAVHGCFGLGLCLSEPFVWIVLGLICAVPDDGERGAVEKRRDPIRMEPKGGSCYDSDG